MDRSSIYYIRYRLRDNLPAIILGQLTDVRAHWAD